MQKNSTIFGAREKIHLCHLLSTFLSTLTFRPREKFHLVQFFIRPLCPPDIFVPPLPEKNSTLSTRPPRFENLILKIYKCKKKFGKNSQKKKKFKKKSFTFQFLKNSTFCPPFVYLLENLILKIFDVKKNFFCKNFKKKIQERIIFVLEKFHLFVTFLSTNIFVRKKFHLCPPFVHLLSTSAKNLILKIYKCKKFFFKNFKKKTKKKNNFRA